MDYKVHILEQEAYGAVLRAFKGQADALTWEKEGLITELRRELRISNDEHRQLLTMVNADEHGIICRIREERVTAPTSRNKRKASQSINPQPAKQQGKKGLRPSRNSYRVLNSDEIEIMHTETLLRKVVKVVAASRPDLREIENARRALREHEEALTCAITKLAEMCDDGSGEDDVREMRGSSSSDEETQDDEDEMMDI